MSVGTVRRCSRCPRVLRRHEDVLCLDCECVDANLRGLGTLREYPIIEVDDLPPGALCALCQNKNTPQRAEAMYHHNDGPKGTHWYAHVSCSMQKEYDRVEEWRDTREERDL